MEDGFSLEGATIGIVGLGLMGGSLALSLKGKCSRILGFDSAPSTLELALSKGIVDSASPFPPSPSWSEEGGGIDVLILATPVSSIIDIIGHISSLISSPCIVMDVGSTKRDITHAMDSLPENFDPIGGHPICGKEKLGIENAEADLFKDTVFVITPLERTTMRAKSAAEQIVSTLGASCIEMTAEEHDKVFAATSHLPFLLSSALVHSTPQEFASFIGPGFRSTARLAGTPSHMMMGILKSNRDNVLNALRSFRSSLSEIESALQTGDFSGLETVLNRSRIAHQALIDN